VINAFTKISFNRWFKLLFGFLCVGTGVSFLKQANLGLSPWEVLNDGVSKTTGYPFGTASILVGIPILLLWIPIGEKLGIGTVLNTVLIGTFINLTLPIIPFASQIALQISWLALGLVMVGLGSAFYLGTRLGAGPRDGLMMGLYRRTGRSIRLVRTILEIGVLVIGWLMGGTIGIGTLTYALSIGSIIQFMFRLIGEHELASGHNRNEPA
jgi:uncharacterized membrane protein YczE